MTLLVASVTNRWQPVVPSLSRSDVQALSAEAHVAAAKLVRQFRLPYHQYEDLRQDVLVDLLVRLRSFDPSRGTLGAFAGTIARHGVARLANRISRERTWQSIEAPTVAKCRAPEDEVLEADGYAPVMSPLTDHIAGVERHLDLDLALETLRPAERDLCLELIDATPTEISRSGKRSRASIYRQLKEIRLHLLMVGISTVAGARTTSEQEHAGKSTPLC